MSETGITNEKAAPAAMYQVITAWINQGQQMVDRNIQATNKMSGAFDTAYSIAAKKTVSCCVEAIQATRTYTINAFEIAQDLMSTKSLPELIEIWANAARRQFNSLAVQRHELRTLSLELVTETTKPITENMTWVFDVSMAWTGMKPAR